MRDDLGELKLVIQVCGDSSRIEVVVEERYRDWQNDEVGYEQDQHTHVPIEPTTRHSINHGCNNF